MALNTTKQEKDPRIYLSINHGKVIQDTREGKTFYDSIDGTLEAIYTRKRVFNGEQVTRWYIDLRDGEQLYTICLPYYSGVFKSIVLSLASDAYLTADSPILIEPYEGTNGYTKVQVYSEGVKLDWITKELPEVELIQVGGRTVKDDSKRMEYIYSLVNTINERVKK